MSNTAPFITLEGGEGVGKSTLMSGLANALAEQGINLVSTREPGGTAPALKLRELLLTRTQDAPWSALEEALLMNAARSHHLNNKIRPSLATNHWVLCDRFMDSTRAYQATGVEPGFLDTLEAQIVGPTRPDLTLILDADPKDLLDRRLSRGAKDQFEDRDLAFHQNVRQQFLAIAQAEPERCRVLDALRAPERVLDDAMSYIEARFLQTGDT